MARRGVDYGAGYSSAIASQYADLRSAIAAEGEAENQRKAREIEDRGLFGSGIKQSDVDDFASIAIKGAEFGDQRMERKLNRATKSYDRRMAADERRITTLKERSKGLAGVDYENLQTEIRGIEMGMGENRNTFEDLMGEYQKKGLWGTSFGGDDVGYRTPGESRYSKAYARDKDGSGDGSGGEGDKKAVGGEGRFGPEGDRLDRYSSYPHQPREFEKVDYETAEERNLEADRMWEKLSRDDDIRERVKALPKVDRDLTGEQRDKGDRMTWENNPLNVDRDGTASNKFSRIFGERRPSGLMDLRDRER